MLPDITPKYRDVEVEGVGTVRMRALNFDEAHDVSNTEFENRKTTLQALKLGLEASEEDVEEWVLSGHSMAVQKVFLKLMAISGGDAEEAEALGNSG